MKDALSRAAAARPEIPGPDEAFQVALRARLQGGDPLDALHLADLLLAHHAARGDPAAVQALAMLLEDLAPELRRTGADDQMVRDVIAELVGDLVAPRDGAEPRIVGYSGRGPLQAWLRVVAVRAVVERRRKTREVTDDLVAGRLVAAGDPEIEVLRSRYAREIEAAFAKALATLAPEERLLLEQHHVDGLSIDRLAALHGIHRATAARRLAAVRESLGEAVRDALVKDLRIGNETYESIVRLVRSEVSLHFPPDLSRTA